MKKTYHILTVLGLICFAVQLTAETYQLGPGKKYTTLKKVPLLRPGDTLEIYSGTYNEYKYWTGNGAVNSPITIKGMGKTKPVFDGKGLELSGRGSTPRALFQFSGNNYIIDNIEFINANNDEGDNGAAIRITGGSNITIRNCKITKCENGMMSDRASNIVIEYCEIGFCGSFEYIGYSHSLYMGGDNISIRGCYIHDSNGGHNVKTRMHYVELLYNYIADANSAEVDLVEAEETEALNSNAVLIGNIIKKRDFPLKKYLNENNSHFVVFGDEIGGARNGTLYMINNTLISGMKANRPLFLCTSEKRKSTEVGSDSKAILYNNIFFGSNDIMLDDFTNERTTGFNNWIPSSADIPSGFKDTLQGIDPGFVSLDRKDYRLKESSPCIDKGVNTLPYLNGNGESNSGVPEYEYVKYLLNKARKSDGKIDLGAYEWVRDAEKEK